MLRTLPSCTEVVLEICPSSSFLLVALVKEAPSIESCKVLKSTIGLGCVRRMVFEKIASRYLVSTKRGSSIPQTLGDNRMKNDL